MSARLVRAVHPAQRWDTPGLGRFLVVLSATLVAVAFVEVISYALYRDPGDAIVGAAVAAVAICSLLARTWVDRGDTVEAVVLIVVGLLALVLLSGILLGVNSAGALAAMIPVVLALPYVRGRALVAVTGSAWLILVLMVTAQEIWPAQTTVPAEAVSAVRIVMSALAGAFVLALLARHSAGFSSTIAARAATADSFRALFSSIPHPSLVVDRGSLEILEANTAAVRAYGRPRESLIGSTLTDLDAGAGADPEVLPSDDAALVRHHRTATGELLTVSLTARPVDFEGRAATIVLAQDIGQQLRAAEQIRFQAQLLDEVGVSVVATDLEGHITYVNRNAVETFGLSPERAKGTLAADVLLLPEDATGATEIATSLARGEQWHGELWALRADGKRFPALVTVVPQFAPDGRPVGTIGTSVDLSDRREAEERLARSQALLSDAERIANTGSFEVDVPSGTVTWSDQLFRIAGLPPQTDPLTYERFLSIVHPDDRERVASTIASSIADGRDYSIEMRGIRPDGSERVVMTQARIVFDADGQPARILGTARDITESRLLEEQLRQSQKMEAVGRLAGGIAHDFNNALTAILGYSQLLGTTMNDTDERAEWVGQINHSAQHAATLTKQLLAFSRRQVLMPEVCDVNGLVERVVPMLERLIGEDIVLVTRLSPPLGRVLADRGQLEQVVVNLAVNARDAMPDGGRLIISTSNIEVGEELAVQHIALKPGPYVSLTVRDTGRGMDEETKRRIFEPFFTTKEVGKGTGLGLATVYGIVNQSGGAIWFYSEPDHGTVFRIFLPRVDAAVPVEPTDSAPDGAPAARNYRGSETVLLVEDDDGVRRLVRSALAEHGYRVIEACNGPEALGAVEGDGAVGVDIVVTDVVMPEMSGIELANRLARLRPELPVVYVSGYTEDAALLSDVLQAGAPYLQKPFTPIALSREIRDVLDGRETRPRARRGVAVA